MCAQANGITRHIDQGRHEGDFSMLISDQEVYRSVLEAISYMNAIIARLLGEDPVTAVAMCSYSDCLTA